MLLLLLFINCHIYLDIVSAGYGISQVTCGMEANPLKKPYIVYRGEHTQL